MPFRLNNCFDSRRNTSSRARRQFVKTFILGVLSIAWWFPERGKPGPPTGGSRTAAYNTSTGCGSTVSSTSISWFYDTRAHGHTRLSLKYYDKPEFREAASRFKRQNASVITRHIKSGGEGAWWPSSVGGIEEIALGKDLAREIIEEAHKEGMFIILYYRHMEDEWVLKYKPEWICVDYTGQPIESPRGVYTCLNSPYRDFVLTRLMELADRGANGFYFDETHMPKTGCWCAYCRSLFTKETGETHPEAPRIDSPKWQQLISFNNRKIEETFNYWRDRLKEKHNDIVLVVGSHRWPSMSDRHLQASQWRTTDSVKTELEIASKYGRDALYRPGEGMPTFDKGAKLSLGYIMCRDAAGGKPAHVWIDGLKTEQAALTATAAVLVHGCIANIDVNEFELPDNVLEPAFSMAEKVSPWLAGTKPFTWIGVHFSEIAKEHYATRPGAVLEHVVYPVYGVYSALLEQRIPVGVVMDHQLHNPVALQETVHALALTSAVDAQTLMREEIGNVRSRGLPVLDSAVGRNWNSAKQFVETKRGFLRDIRHIMEEFPIKVLGGPAGMQAHYFLEAESDRLIIALCNDFAWVETGRQAQTRPGSVVLCIGVSLLVARFRLKEAYSVLDDQQILVENRQDKQEISVPPFVYMSVIVLDGKY